MKVSDQVIAALQQAVAGLLYSTESDEPWEVFQWPACPSPVTPEEVLTRSGHPAGTAVTQQSVEDFFRNLTQDKDWYGEEERKVMQRYRDLLTTLQQCLPDAQVFRVGKVRVEVYLVGRLSDGGCAGIKTVAVET